MTPMQGLVRQLLFAGHYSSALHKQQKGVFGLLELMIQVGLRFISAKTVTAETLTNTPVQSAAPSTTSKIIILYLKPDLLCVP